MVFFIAINILMEDIIHKISYVSHEEVKKIKHFYDITINDKFSNGPKKNIKVEGVSEGCWDRPLRLDNNNNPLITVINKLHKDFGNFEIHTASVRYLAFPFAPHTDIRDTSWYQNYRKKYSRGYTFIIPLWWNHDYQAGTAFFSCPPEDDQPLYEEYNDCLTQYSDVGKVAGKNFGVKKIIQWQSPGDLIAWKNFQWHCSLSPRGYSYNLEKWVKEFISIETGYLKEK